MLRHLTPVLGLLFGFSLALPGQNAATRPATSATSKPASSASLDLERTARLLAEKVGGKWQVRTHKLGSGRQLEYIDGVVDTARGKAAWAEGKASVDVFQFSLNEQSIGVLGEFYESMQAPFVVFAVGPNCLAVSWADPADPALRKVIAVLDLKAPEGGPVWPGRKMPASASEPAERNAFGALGIDSIVKAEVKWYAKGTPGGVTKSFPLTEKEVLAEIERLLRAMPAKTDISKKFDSEMESWDLVLAGKNGKTLSLHFIGTAMMAPEGGWISDQDSLAMVALFRKALAGQPASAPASRPWK